MKWYSIDHLQITQMQQNLKPWINDVIPICLKQNQMEFWITPVMFLFMSSKSMSLSYWHKFVLCLKSFGWWVKKPGFDRHIQQHSWREQPSQRNQSKKVNLYWSDWGQSLSLFEPDLVPVWVWFGLSLDLVLSPFRSSQSWFGSSDVIVWVWFSICLDLV